jgi:predicted flap endonuclease-1-like 5' DNA nuclease
MANQKIEAIEGIGPATGDKLRAAGVKDTDTLLAASATPTARKALAGISGLTEAQVLKFANMADLYRVKGVGSEFAELLEAVGVDTVPALARRNAANLNEALATTNAAKKLTRRVPTEAEVAGWIDSAKALPRALDY